MSFITEKELSPCPLRSDCSAEANRAFYDTMFEKEWEVFVIRFDSHNDKFETSTYCCVQAISGG